MELVSTANRTKSTKRSISDQHSPVNRKRDKDSRLQIYHAETVYDTTGDAVSTFEASKTEYATVLLHIKHGSVGFF